VLYVALWQADGFLKRPVQQIRIKPGAERLFNFEVPAGCWALSVFEDRNGNGILDMGFSWAEGTRRVLARLHRPPKTRFDEAASVVERNVPDADIVLK
jgi:hypothetical protein